MPHWPFRIALIGAGSPLAAAVREGLVRAGFAVEYFDLQAAAQASLIAAPTAWVLLAMNPPEPSHNVAFTPPTCLLRAEMEVSNGEPDGWVGTGNTPAPR